GRYGMHDLLRAYAAELSRAHDATAERDAARHRMLDHYLHTAYAADLHLDPYRVRIAMPLAGSGVTLEPAADAKAANAWFRDEYDVLRAAVPLAFDAGAGGHAGGRTWSLTTSFPRLGYWQDFVATQLVGLRAAERLADDSARAHAHRGVGAAYARLGQPDLADDHFRRALD